VDSNDVTSVLVGIDSGGSRTNVEININNGPTIIKAYEKNESLSGVLSPHEYSRVMRNILAPLSEAYRKHHVPKNSVTCMMISTAAYTPWVRDEMLAAVVGGSRDLGIGEFSTIGVCNDCVAFLYGLDVDGIVIAGTGSDILFRTHGPTSRVCHVGGDEWVVADQGSGFWIALRGLRVAYNDLRLDNDSPLLQRLREHFNVRRDPMADKEVMYGRLRELALGRPDMKKEIARFARQVCNAAERGDEDAREIVLGEARELADLVVECIRKAYPRIPDKLSIAQCGGVFENMFYRTSFEQQFEGHFNFSSERAMSVSWLQASTATRAALNLARVLRDDPELLLSIDAGFRPLLVPLGTAEHGRSPNP
jgi:N-acetylglucosamine kinase-like BadF-type ATPase